ncbi:hsp40 co-chaperone [Sporothrix brasiliensis 5110]|uniref:Hsp40 co-chaperone n=1 Tax=Sporothrix brasiliensis 5110 TaxID=1398154 RepID=A0A0C2JAF7_9PEZI|nr:hsp40 co-chaperone [Sporothrix brasiliensis 5110]KIH93897.1 hsp40 co-chaperone [Sporothrix brasiliensis 5110]
MGACPYCCNARAALTRAPRRTTVAPLARLSRPLSRPVSGRPSVRPDARPIQRTTSTRAYATAIHDDGFLHSDDGHAHGRHRPREHGSDGRGEMAHHTWPASPNPTPYEIFGQHKTAAYQKKRFYALAKQYHPDMHHGTPAHVKGLSPAVRLERYRLIVAANDILSHAGRRRMYDLYGQGWASPGDQGKMKAGGEYDHTWRQRKGSAAYNATWEDWERWRQENGAGPSGDAAGAKQTEQFMSNGGFAVVVLVLVFLGGYGQMTRASSHGASILARRDEHDAAISSTLQSQQAAIAPLSRAGRVDSFLERREGWGTYETAGLLAQSDARRRGS